MNSNLEKLYEKLKALGLSPEQYEIISREIDGYEQHALPAESFANDGLPRIYNMFDFEVLQNMQINQESYFSALKTLEELLEQDKQREADGFPRRIRLGKLIKPDKDNKGKVIVVPTTTEPKFYHDDSITEENEEEATGGTGEGEEGEVIGEQPAQPQQGEGEGQGAGQGESSEHDVSQDAFDLGKVLTEKFQLPNLKNKGSKRAFTKYIYDLTDRNRGFGQLLDKKATLRKIIETNILLGNIKQNQPFKPENLILNPRDQIYRVMSQEKDFESQAVVFFVRDYSGSMQGKPTEVVATQHLFIYSWLMYQYQSNVVTKFIVHDTQAKEVEDFYKYHRLQVAGGTNVAPAFKLVNEIIEKEQLHISYNIYVFYGTDGDDWDDKGTELIEEIKKLLLKSNRLGITVAKNSWTADGKTTTVEKNIQNSGLLKDKPELIKIDSFAAANASESRIIESIRKLVE